MLAGYDFSYRRVRSRIRRVGIIYACHFLIQSTTLCNCSPSGETTRCSSASYSMWPGVRPYGETDGRLQSLLGSRGPRRTPEVLAAQFSRSPVFTSPAGACCCLLSFSAASSLLLTSNKRLIKVQEHCAIIS